MVHFHIKYRKAISLLYVVLIPIAVYMFSQMLPLNISQILGCIYLIIPLPLVWYLGVLSISDKGIIYKRFHKLVWADITEARKSKFLGFDIIYIKRKKGAAWSLPLYFIGEKTMKEALLMYAPKSNPIYEIATEL